MIEFFKITVLRKMTFEQQREFNVTCIRKAFKILDRNRQEKINYKNKKTLKELIFEKVDYISTHCFTSLGSDVVPNGVDFYDELCNDAIEGENKLVLIALSKIDRNHFAYKFDGLNNSEYDLYQIAKIITEYYQIK